MKKITFIRTGGQTGVDRAALDFARKHNISLLVGALKMGGRKICHTLPELERSTPN